MSKKAITENNNPEYDQLLLNVGETLEQGRQRKNAQTHIRQYINRKRH